IYAAFSEAVVPGATEGEAVGAGVAKAATIPGCAHWNFLSAAGPDAGRLADNSLPAWKPHYRYQAGDVVHADCYGILGGDAYDLARTRVVANAESDDQARVSRDTRAVCARIARALRPGATPRELHRVGTEALMDADLKSLSPTFGHAIGAGFFRPYLVA